MSLRSTRAGGTPPSCSNGGNAQPIATANAVIGPSTAPCQLGGGSCASMKSASSAVKPNCATKPDRAADHAGGDDEHQELQEVQAQHLAMPGAEAFHQRNGIESPCDEAPRGHRDGNAAEQHADERRQHEKPLCVGNGRADFGPPVAKILELVLRPQQRRRDPRETPRRPPCRRHRARRTRRCCPARASPTRARPRSSTAPSARSP